MSLQSFLKILLKNYATGQPWTEGGGWEKKGGSGGLASFERKTKGDRGADLMDDMECMDSAKCMDLEGNCSNNFEGKQREARGQRLHLQSLYLQYLSYKRQVMSLGGKCPSLPPFRNMWPLPLFAKFQKKKWLNRKLELDQGEMVT